MRQVTEDESLVGREIAGYRITSVIGRGGMGVVYLAHHIRLERKVALKLLRPEASHDAGYRGRFLRESRLAAALDHPNVVPVHDADEAGGQLYIAMRFVDGQDLRSLLAEGPLEPRRALMLAGQIAAALDAAHVRGLVHRDVKPGNILVDDADHAYLTDFGIAVEVDASAAAVAGPGSTAGTLAYLAPEQIEGEPLDGRADQYALACVIYECLAGRPPFSGRSSGLALLWAHLEEPPPALNGAGPSMPADVDAVLARGMAKRAADRFPSCAALIAAARDALASTAVGALPAELDGPAPPLVGRASELAALRDAWQGARRGAGALTLVSGARGAGKTRLAAELARELQGGVGVRYVSAVAGEAELLAALAPANEPALVVVEDLDGASDAIVAALEASVRERPVLVVGTFRDAASPALEELAARVPHLRLGPLDADAVRAVAELHAGGDARDLPLESVLEASAGMPGSVHEVVGEWARSAATRRLRASAGRVADGRSDLREAEAAVAEDVQALQLIRERVRIYFPELGATDARRGPPFKGLATFNAADADRFFGRERLVAELVALLAGAPVLCLVGASGSGKSSLLRAGLLPVLAGGAIAGSERWRQIVLRPGGNELAAVLRDPPGERTLLAIDQLEEVFAADRSDAERAEFLRAVVAAASDERFVVVLCLRADFYGRGAEIPELAELLDRHSVLVGPMRPEELRRAIELPAARAGVEVERELVDALVRDVADRPGALPLLSTALLELWQARDGRTLTRAAYERSGGVRGAVARLAESAYGELSEPERRVARAAFLRLCDETASGDAAVRRRAPLAEFDTEADERLRRVLAVLTSHRLIAVDDHSVEVAHEALLQEWPRLRGWLDEDAEGRRVRRDLRDAASGWRGGGRDLGDLYRGARLAGTVSWAQRHEPELNALEREYLEASQAAAEQDTRRMRRTNSRLRVLLAGVAVLLAAATAGGIVALFQADRAREAEVSALAERLGAQALIDEPLGRSVLLARQAVELEDSIQTRSSLLAALLRSPAALRVIPGNGERLLRTAMAPNGRLLAVADNTDSVLLIDPRTYERAGPALRLPAQAEMLEFSPDSRTLAVSSVGPDAGHLQLYDVTTGDLGPDRRTRAFGVTGIAFSPDGRTVVVGDTGFADGVPNRLVRLDASTLRPLGRHVTLPAGRVTTHYLGRERVVASWIDFNGRDRDGATVVFDARSLDRIRTVSRGFEHVAVDGRRLVAFPRLDSGIDLLDARSGRIRTLAGTHEGDVTGLAFTRDGRTLVTSGGDDGRIVVWDVASGQQREVIRGHSGRAFGPVFTPDGKTLLTVGLDSSIIAWDVAGSRRLGRAFATGGAPPAEGVDASLDPVVGGDGRTYYVPTNDGKITFWRAADLTPARAPVDLGAPLDLAAAPDGRTLAAATSRGDVVLLDASGAVRAQRRVGSRQPMPPQIAFRPDGRLLAVATERGVTLLDTVTRRRRGAALDVNAPAAVAFSPDGGRLSLGTFDGGVEVWDIAQRRRLFRRQVSKFPVYAVDYSPNGRTIATGGDDGYLRFLDAGSGRQSGGRVRAHDGFVMRTGFSPDGRIVFSTGSDSAVSLWDVRSRTQLGAPLPVGQGAVFAAFADDGSSLLAVSEVGGAVAWSVDPAEWKARACALAGRTLTRAEWATLLPERPYSPACS